MHVKNPRIPLAAAAAALVAVLALLLAPTPLRSRVQATALDPATTTPAGTAPATTTPAGSPPRPTTPGGTTTDPGNTAADPGSTVADPGRTGDDARLPGATEPGTLPPVVDHGPRTGGKVALTFDADMTDAMRRQLHGPNPPSYANLAIVELLERQRVPATFFLTGKWVREYPELTRRLAANPRFELANHTYGHAAFTSDCYHLTPLPRREMTADVARTFDVIAPYGGRQTRYFRFPGLCHDRTALAELAPLGLTVVDGDVVSGDPFAKYWQPIVRAVLSQVRPGSVIILHVTEANAPMTDEALPHILAGLAERGLEPAPLSEVLGDPARVAPRS
ncbi:polysaccharide deacetylase family protein [Micromonospora coxensis]|uniref:Peptidoglycan/xylan/chitin deacetylase, PgdA/CDA1 family n=1 Tax=Micromonospora coxensis TaxID=356852 RepID=A0A1C5I2U8_9ACTN|nr:polysaccharide deacetylase family protein [Micromonospora coxensis]SCG52439.1 Peptidoglycan/xylan/chitin deacetylase, PgdA/CDA1 family [Micromonospora coxensis]